MQVDLSIAEIYKISVLKARTMISINDESSKFLVQDFDVYERRLKVDIFFFCIDYF